MSNVVGTILNVGLSDKDTLTQVIDTREAVQMIANLVGDCTIMQGFGFYTHADGRKVCETSLEVKCYGVSMDEGKEYAEILCRQLNQECICVTPIYETATEFVSVG